MLIKVDNGYKIKSHVTGKVLPKVYPSKEKANKRIERMEMHKMIKSKKVE